MKQDSNMAYNDRIEAIRNDEFPMLHGNEGIALLRRYQVNS
jgi:hypothetical protein